MKQFYLFILFIFFCSLHLFPQAGTIKVKKPLPPQTSKNDSAVAYPKYLRISAEAGINYSFKKNDKIGYQVGLYCIAHEFSIGIKYSVENQYYQLSPFNKTLMRPEVESGKAGNRSQYISIPLNVFTKMCVGAGCCGFYIGLAPEYLIKTKNQFNRLTDSDFNRFNLSGNVSVSTYPEKRIVCMLTYSKDFFDNLKDKNIYDSGGVITGKQKSKTNLITFTFRYRFINQKLR